MEFQVALDALDELVHSAKRVPLSTTRRVDRATLSAGVERIEREFDLAAGPGGIASLGAPATDTRASLDVLRALARDGRRIPFTDDVRFDVEVAYDHLDRLRATAFGILAERVRGHDG